MWHSIDKKQKEKNHFQFNILIDQQKENYIK